MQRRLFEGANNLIEVTLYGRIQESRRRFTEIVKARRSLWYQTRKPGGQTRFCFAVSAIGCTSTSAAFERTAGELCLT